MIYARFLTSGTVLATLVFALVLGSEAQTRQWCQGVYDQKGGSNFSSACPPAPPPPPLYRRLGGRDGIAVVVGDFVAFVVADNRINARFKGLKPPEVEKLKSNLSDQICEATGGPCSYLGRDMKTTHKGMMITMPNGTRRLRISERRSRRTRSVRPSRASSSKRSDR